MKRSCEGGALDSGRGDGAASFVPVPLARQFLSGERTVAVVAVTPSGVPVFLSANLLAVGNADAHLAPAGLDLGSVRCDEGILIASCAGGIFVVTGFNYTVQFTISMPFAPDNPAILMTDGVPSVCCSKNDTVLYFSAETDSPVDVRADTVPGQVVTSIVRDYHRSCVDAVFSDGRRIRMEGGQIGPARAVEAGSALIGFHVGKELDFVQRSNFNVVIFHNAVPMGIVPMGGVCRGLLWGKFSACFLASDLDPCPELLVFEYVSMSKLDSLYPQAAAQSLALDGHECTSAAGNYLLYRGGIYHLSETL